MLNWKKSVILSNQFIMLEWGCFPVQNNNGSQFSAGIGLVTCGNSAVKIIFGSSWVLYDSKYYIRIQRFNKNYYVKKMQH